MTKLLIVVDVQNDFMPAGALAVPDGDEVVPGINRIRGDYDLVVFTQDCHPENHCSFEAQGGPWPPHCVQGTHGAALVSTLTAEDTDSFWLKGYKTEYEAYSPFGAENDAPSGFAHYLHSLGVTEIGVAGVAAEYCVLQTALDALDAGFEVTVHLQSIRGITEDGTAEAFERMAAKGAKLVLVEHPLLQAVRKGDGE